MERGDARRGRPARRDAAPRGRGHGRHGRGPGLTAPLGRVVLVTPTTRARGVAVHTLALAEALARVGVSTHVVGAGDPSAGMYRETVVPCTVVPAPRAETLEGRIGGAVTAITSALDGLSLGPGDVVHAHSVVGMAALAVARTTGAAVVRTVHHVGRTETELLEEWQRRSIVEADRCVAVSRRVAEGVRWLYGVAPEVVTNGVDVARFDAPAERAAGEGFTFLSVGAVEPRKNTLGLIDAFASLTGPRGRDARLVLVGGSRPGGRGYLAAVAQRVAALGLEERVVRTGIVADDEVVAWYRSADAFVSASRDEGWGLVVLEAMAAGLPVVATAIPVLGEYLSEGDALLAPVDDTAALAEGMQRLLDDDALARALRERGRAVASRHTWDRAAAAHLAVYEEAVAERGRRAGKRG